MRRWSLSAPSVKISAWLRTSRNERNSASSARAPRRRRSPSWRVAATARSALRFRRALREHVANQDPGVLFPPQGPDSPASATDPVKAGAVEPPQHVGPEEVA